jgi:hypothetical protein
MKDLNFYQQKFIDKHNIIDDIDKLNEYISFIINYNKDGITDSTYCERHHILPKCKFPEYVKDDWNIITLKYEDHIYVHNLLFEAIHTKYYLYPLLCMNNRPKNNSLLSIATKKSWEIFRETETYLSWKEKRSQHMKSLGKEEQSRRANIFWKNISKKDYDNFINKLKNYWTNERKKERSEQMKYYYSDHYNKARASLLNKEKWDSYSDEFREDFKQKMSMVNKKMDKRLDAGEKIKKLWKDEKYLDKMRNRSHRSGKVLK